MTTRQSLDRAVMRTTGKDIRLVGNWQPLWCLRHSSAVIAAEIRVRESDLLRCSDITEILLLMEERSRSQTAAFDIPGQRSLFAL